jgi:hypothetical protein
MSVKIWYYQINVREGVRGFADNDSYKSRNFDSFEECYCSYIKFNPHSHWQCLRYISSEDFVYVNDNNEHINNAKGGIIYYINSENELGITECDFEKLIDKLS